ncbi:MAG: hypothetical protein HZC40_16685 [Chloroflexi bacterium]|nr:hypothetical protein [Chloroflexota bacterium]
MPSSIFNSIIHRHKPGIQLSVDLWLALALAYGGGLWLHWIHELEGAMEHDAPPVLLHWLRDATLLLPLMLGAVIAARLIARRLYLTGARRSIAIAFVASALMGGASPLHQILFDAHHHAALGASVLVHSARDTLLALIANLVIVSAVALIRQPRRWARQRVILRAVLAITLITNFLAPLAPTVSAAPAAQTANVCATATRTITYDVAAFQTIIPHNGWGDHTPDGLMFALSNADAIPNKDALIANPNLIEPLVIRAAVGDCILVNFRNDITGRRVGMHVNGISKDPKTSDGARIGNNPDTTVPTGGTITHTFFAHREGQFVINDYGSGLNYPNDTTSRGLYGALIVLPRGATWHDPRTGRDLLDASKRGVGAMPFADARVPGVGNDFRDFVAVFMDEPEGVLDRDGKPPVFPLTGIEDGTFGINYRSEPLRNRARAVLEHRGLVYDAAQNKIVATAPKVVTLPNGTVIQPTDHFCDGYVPELDQIVSDPGAQCVGEEFHLQSWPFGDPGKLTRKLADGTIVADTDSIIPKAYVGDPVRFRIVHPGVYETHTWHQHTNRWRHEPNDPDSTRLDVQSTGPGQTFELDFEGGAGQMMGTVGDQVFHCHLYPHFAEGFCRCARTILLSRVH